jgi:hypothetical protein
MINGLKFMQNDKDCFPISIIGQYHSQEKMVQEKFYADSRNSSNHSLPFDFLSVLCSIRIVPS